MKNLLKILNAFVVARNDYVDARSWLEDTLEKTFPKISYIATTAYGTIMITDKALQEHIDIDINDFGKILFDIKQDGKDFSSITFEDIIKYNNKL